MTRMDLYVSVHVTSEGAFVHVMFCGLYVQV